MWYDSKEFKKLVKDSKSVLKNLYGVNSLLAAPSSNPKIEKNKKHGVLTSPLHGSPEKTAGLGNFCAKATPECKFLCLHTAGNPIYWPNKEKARKNRIKAFKYARKDFLIVLINEIAALNRAAKRQQMQPGCRLNATTDIPYENVKIDIPELFVNHKNIFEVFPETEFYDYSKLENRLTKDLPVNYHLTFSLAENNDSDAKLALDNDINVAVIFDTKRNRPLPEFYELGGTKYPVIDGDDHDFRPVDPKRVVVGLRAKGKAIGRSYIVNPMVKPGIEEFRNDQPKT